MTPAFAVLVVSVFCLLLALGAWVVGPDEEHVDARRRADLGDKWWHQA